MNGDPFVAFIESRRVLVESINYNSRGRRYIHAIPTVVKNIDARTMLHIRLFTFCIY